MACSRAYEVLVVLLSARVPRRSIYYYNKQHEVYVLELVLAFWHQKNDKLKWQTV